jgi:hypothetical protein
MSTAVRNLVRQINHCNLNYLTFDDRSIPVKVQSPVHSDFDTFRANGSYAQQLLV